MTPLEQQIRTVQRRLWFDRWLGCATWSLMVAGLVYAAIVLVQRLFDLPIPLAPIGVGVAATAWLLSVVWAVVLREDKVRAAAALDKAAGLKERLSSGHYCIGQDDPFARAVVADAQRISASISPRQHIRFHLPQALAASVGSIALAALMFLITPGLLKSTEAKETKQREESVRQAHVAVKREMEQLREIVEATPALEDLKDEAKQLDARTGGQLRRPEDVRMEAAKKIDNLADAVKQKRNNPKYDAMREMQKRLRTLKVPPSDEVATRKLTKALQQGDFKKAKEEIKALQEQLATLKSENDQEMVKKLSEQLDALSKQLEKLAQEEKLADKLAQSGVKKEDVDRLLETLKKKDLEQIKNALQEKGLSEQKAESLAKQIKQNQQASGMAKQLAQSMKQASQGAAAGSESEAAAGLSSSGDQLSELEQLEQEMNQLESTMAAMQEAQEKMGQGCTQCNGTGKVGNKPCSRCGGSGTQPGGGMGKLGQGRGGLAPEEETGVDFKTERGKVKTTQGAIIGQFLVDGEQVKGEVNTEFVELMNSAEREASDRINRDRIPRQYQKAVKSYFSSVQESLEKMKRQDSTTTEDASDQPGAESSSEPD